MKTFYFDTGVNPLLRTELYGEQIVKNGTVQIPVIVADSVPDNAILLFCGDRPDSEKGPRVMVTEILNCGPKAILSKFAYFRV